MRETMKVVDVAISEKEWAQAEAKIEKLLANQRCALAIKASVFGAVYFKKGWCEYRQKKWAEAIGSFKACYQKFPSNRNDKNQYHHESLRRWADALYMMKDYEEAARLYRKYISESAK